MNQFPFRSALRALLPAALLLASCSKDDKPTPPPPVVPDQGRIDFYHAAASANLSVKFLVDNADKGTRIYGQNTGYQDFVVGSRTIAVTVASSGAPAFAPVTAMVEKGKSYSFFAYSTTPTDAVGLLLSDDLTAPSAAPSPGKAKIRLVNLAQGGAAAARLSTTVAGVADIVGTAAAFGQASGFVEILPGSYNVAVTTGTPSTAVTNGNVGDGTGTGTVATAPAVNKNYEAGKIYTVIYRGITGTTVAPELLPRAFIVQNN